jgi:hypothetical protein
VLERVPTGMTSVGQPADVAWMKPLKDRLRAAWVQSIREQLAKRDPAMPFRLLPPTRSTVAEWILQAWEGLTTVTIVGGFTRTHLDITEAEAAHNRAVHDIVKKLESLSAVDTVVGEIGSDDDFDSQ